MNILEKIVEHKKCEIEKRRTLISEDMLLNSRHYGLPCRSLKASLRTRKPGIIAEFKRKSPSKGWIHQSAEVIPIVTKYQAGGVAAVSILTDESFFGGSSDDLIAARDVLSLPILRKDFIIDDYQLLESKALGADVILLIAACLTPGEVRHLAATAKKIGLEVLLEIHCEEEILHICDNVDLVGINNRDLKTFIVNINKSISLSEKVSKEKDIISESGINTASEILLLRTHGFTGFLLGEKFMKSPDPGTECKILINEILGHENQSMRNNET